jgi:retron-type reverse transcriptase
MDSGGGWVLEVDIRKFFDTLDHAHLREFLQHRVRDGVLKRLIGKWLKAGVMTWDRFNRLLERYRLPPPRIVHSYVK